jgi:hypothetical protein
MPTRLASFVAIVLAARLAFAPFATADEHPPATPIRESAAREAARAAESARGKMPGGLKWTGISLIAFSAWPIAHAIEGNCSPDDEFSCRDERAFAAAVGGVMAGTGALLLVIGHHKRDRGNSRLPEVTYTRGRAAVVQRITF